MQGVIAGLVLLRMDLCNFFHWRESEDLMYTLTWEIYTSLQLFWITPAFAVIF